MCVRAQFLFCYRGEWERILSEVINCQKKKKAGGGKKFKILKSIWEIFSLNFNCQSDIKEINSFSDSAEDYFISSLACKSLIQIFRSQEEARWKWLKFLCGKGNEVNFLYILKSERKEEEESVKSLMRKIFMRFF